MVGCPWFTSEAEPPPVSAATEALSGRNLAIRWGKKQLACIDPKGQNSGLSGDSFFFPFLFFFFLQVFLQPQRN